AGVRAGGPAVRRRRGRGGATGPDRGVAPGRAVAGGRGAAGPADDAGAGAGDADDVRVPVRAGVTRAARGDHRGDFARPRALNEGKRQWGDGTRRYWSVPPHPPGRALRPCTPRGLIMNEGFGGTPPTPHGRGAAPAPREGS